MGLNYQGKLHELGGCINDGNRLQQSLVTTLQYPKDSIIMMNDSSEELLRPTKHEYYNTTRKFSG